MKHLSIFLVSLLFVVSAFADVKTKILQVTQDDKGAIWVKYQILVDDKEINACNYPDTIDGKHYCTFRFSIQNVQGGNDPVKIQNFVDTQTKAFAEQIIKRPYEIQFQSEAKVAQNLLAQSDAVKGLVGRETTVIETTVLRDINFDGTPDKELTVDTKGIKGEKDYIVSITETK